MQRVAQTEDNVAIPPAPQHRCSLHRSSLEIARRLPSRALFFGARDTASHSMHLKRELRCKPPRRGSFVPCHAAVPEMRGPKCGAQNAGAAGPPAGPAARNRRARRSSPKWPFSLSQLRVYPKAAHGFPLHTSFLLHTHSQRASPHLTPTLVLTPTLTPTPEERLHTSTHLTPTLTPTSHHCTRFWV